ncbi:hypothetical protein HPP92_026407 [Vanilla planifolia]|uniref:Uncharacterized protein n=1 Tax=Vanilla planifolia TaxID=51239 RepID=A0A835PJN5_VANPL|nr:hypothetical protein HPP92_026407 [Vanilla planifolia]
MGSTCFESQSSSLAIIDSGSILDTRDEHAGTSCGSANFDMNAADFVGNQVDGLVPTSRGQLSPMHDAVLPQEASQRNLLNANGDLVNVNAIDPTFLEALPEDLRAEVLASQQAQSSQTASYAPPIAEDIDPEFLAALPPDIQAEVLAQQRAQRDGHIHQGQGQPVDMDNASIIATFAPELREEVLLTSSDAVLSALPSALLAEAQMLRDRAASHYSARSSLFSGSPRVGVRRLAVDRPPLGKGLLQRLLLNLCTHSGTRACLVMLLVDIIKPEAGMSSGSKSCYHRLYGCQWNVVYGRPQPADGLPPLFARRILEMLTYLATNHTSVANILFYFDPLVASECTSSNIHLGMEEKTKEKASVPKDTSAFERDDIPLVILLKLLNRPLFLRSSAHLEQVMNLIQVIVYNAVSRIDCEPQSIPDASNFETIKDISPSDGLKHSTVLEQNHAQDFNSSRSNLQASSGEKSFSPYDIFLQVPKPDLCNLCQILAQTGLSEKVYSLVADVMEKLAFVVAPHRKFFAVELAELAHNLSISAVGELLTLRSKNMLDISAGSMAGASFFTCCTDP